MSRSYRRRNPKEKYVHKAGAKLYHAIGDGPWGFFMPDSRNSPCPACHSVCPDPWTITETPPDRLRPCKQCLNQVARETALEMMGATDQTKEG